MVIHHSPCFAFRIVFAICSSELPRNCSGRIVVQKSERYAWYWLSLAAEQEHTGAQVALGNLCLVGDATSPADAFQWYSLAAGAESPHPDALFNLGNMLYEGTCGWQGG